MSELPLKYGCNPCQKPARIFMQDGRELPVKVFSGTSGYINFLDALNGWQLVRELKEVTGFPATTSFKHVSPAGAACGHPLSDTLKKIYWVEDDRELSPLACVYTRTRGADHMSSFGDLTAFSDICDVDTVRLIKREVSDGVIAPGYTEEALTILREEKKGKYNVIEIDSPHRPAAMEVEQVFGVCLEQGRNELPLARELLNNVATEAKEIPESARTDLLTVLITLKYTQSNSVCYVLDGQTIGIGAGQQSRVHCTRLAEQKADNWHLRQSPKVLNLPFCLDVKRVDRDNTVDVYVDEKSEDLLRDGSWERAFTVRPEAFTWEEKCQWPDTLHGVPLVPDAFFPFGDNTERARKSGAFYIAESGGSIRDDQVIETCNRYGIATTFTGIRLFHH